MGQASKRKLRGGLKQLSIALVTIVLVRQPSNGVYRWLVLSLVALVLAPKGLPYHKSTNLPNSGVASQLALETFLPQLVLSLLVLDIERLQPLAKTQGIDIHIIRCKI